MVSYGDEWEDEHPEINLLVSESRGSADRKESGPEPQQNLRKRLDQRNREARRSEA